MKFDKFTLLAAIAGALALSACQTTRDNAFSEWQEMPIGASRFNVPSISSVPVTKLEQNNRNNGQVQNEKWELACGLGYITLQYTFDAWFKQTEEEEMNNQEKFIAQFKERKIAVSNIEAVSNKNGRSVGYLADAQLSDGTSCKAAAFGFRANRGFKGYNNDHGGIDTAVNGIYCGPMPFDMEKLTSQISLVEDRDAYAIAVQRLPTMECSAKGKKPEQASWLDRSKERPDYRTMAMTWNKKLTEGYLKTDVDIVSGGGTLKFSGAESSSCTTKLELTKFAFPEQGTWSIDCTNGDFASGKFYVDDNYNLVASGNGKTGESVDFTIWL